MPAYQEILKQNFTDVRKLCAFLKLPPQAAVLFSPKMPLNLPLRLAKKIAPSNLKDPILRQFLPLKAELSKQPHFKKDPLAEKKFCQGNFIQKYKNRALLLCSNCCAMHCRFCFRQHLPPAKTTNFDLELSQIAQQTALTEIILSGGDPLALKNTELQALLQKIAKIPHIQRLRIHSRFPIGIPERIDDALLQILADFPKQVLLVLHINHPRELDIDITQALRKIQKLGIPIFSQAVLLKGVNNNLSVLLELAETLSNHGIIFYYLHQLDQVAGATHFQVKKATGLQLIKKLRQKTSGYAVPCYVKEIPHKHSKTPLV